MKHKIIPFNDNILVRKIKEKEKMSAGGIIMPDVTVPGKASTAGRNFHVEVLAIGPKAAKDCEGLEVGDILLTGRWHCEMVLIEGQQHGCIKPDGIIGKVVNP